MANNPQMYGRGGAGNIKNKPNEIGTVEGLETPTIKQDMYTTGRGGSGNMARQASAEETRRAQDVEAPVAHHKELKGTYHWGRGGEGNQVTIGEEEKRPKSKERSQTRSKERRLSKGAGERRGSAKVLEKGKEMLGWSNKEKEKANGNGNGSAIADD